MMPPGGGDDPRGHRRDVMDDMLHALKQSMSRVEEVEEQRLQLQMEHEEEKQMLREQLEAEWEEESQAFREECDRKMAEITADMKEYEKDCEKRIEKMEEEKAEMEMRMTSKRQEFERDKSDMERSAQEFRSACQKAMEEEKEEAEKRLAAEKERMEQEIFAVREEHRRLAAEKERMLKEMADVRQEQQRTLAAEQRRMEQEMAVIREEQQRAIQDQRGEAMRQMNDVRIETEKKIAQEKIETERKMNQTRAANEKMAEEKAWVLQKKTEQHRQECEEKILAYEREMDKKTNMSQAEIAKVTREKADMQSNIESFRRDLEKKMEEDKATMKAAMEKYRAECEEKVQQEAVMNEAKLAALRGDLKKMAADKEEMSRDTLEFRAQCETILAEQKEDMARKGKEQRAQLEQMSKEKEAAFVKYRKENESRMAEEKARMDKKMREVHNQCEDQIVKEKQKMDRTLDQARKQTEAQLKAEREITESVRHALKELPPLQTAMEMGDLKLLESELDKWTGDVLPDRFGECKGVVDAVVKLARERFLTWRSVCHTLKDVLRESDRVQGNTQTLQDMCQKLFRALKEAQLTRLDLTRSDADSVARVMELFLLWQERAFLNSNNVQKKIIENVIGCSDLGPFDFADLDICMRLVDREPVGSEIFLSRAQAVVDDKTTKPKDLRATLSHIETMLFFLKYTKSEDLRLTYVEFGKSRTSLETVVQSYLQWAEQRYPPGKELVQIAQNHNMNNSEEVGAVLQQLRRPPNMRGADPLAQFREIFYLWALAMKSKFDLLVLPHHTQVVCLLMFQCFLEAKKSAGTPHSLIAQVGTGEGKSMIVAALAIYCVVTLGKKVHVVVDDETLLERDFGTFKSLFDAFEVPGPAGGKRKLKSVLCVPAEKLNSNRGDSSMSARIDPDADICYCEAKHVQSFYASIARAEKRDFASYDSRILILDEVDALVIDEEPNEPFVYPNKELCDMATAVARTLRKGSPPEVVQEEFGRNQHPATARVVREMCKEWERARQLQPGEDFVFAKEVGKYCKLRSGRADAKAWSLALECRNFQDDLSKEILFQERLFVMSRPRVFKKYHRILGLSGSIGSDAERSFLKETYKASFFEVPPFLKTCKGSPYREAAAVPLGMQKQKVFVEASAEAQVERISEIALEAREKVPVLIIAKDRGHADMIVEGLQQAALKRGLGGAVDDVVRLLSRSLYESDPEQWKENLNRSTLPMGDRTRGGKSWRITVTDPRGGRGTDYRVDDPDVDSLGGLLLIPALVPTSQRDWKQFIGRTARQDRKGQYCCVLNGSTYKPLALKYKQPLAAVGGLEIVETILSWGDKEVAEKIQASAALFMSGVRLNELCEEVFGNRPELLRDANARERLVDVCQRLRWLSVRDIDEAFGRITTFDPKTVPTEARDLGKPEEPAQPYPSSSPSKAPTSRLSHGPSNGASQQKSVIFALDWSCSMLSQDAGNGMTRFGTAVNCVQRLLRDQVRDTDNVSVVGFGSRVETVFKPTPKGDGRQLSQAIAKLRPDMAGGTCFFDAVANSLQMLENQPQSSRWLVCLTDGDDLGSRKENMAGQIVTQMVSSGQVKNLNMVMITIGRLKERQVQVISSWVSTVSRFGGVGKHVAEKDASLITKAFEVVAEVMAAEVGGNIEI